MLNKKLVIIGNYGATNIGDEAILSGMLKLLRTRVSAENITVLSYNPADTALRHSVAAEYPLPFGVRSLLKFRFFKTLRLIKKADYVILGGGGLFTDEKIKAMLLWGYHVLAARLLKRKVMLLGNSIGPVNSRTGKWILQKVVLSASHINLRDRLSFELLKGLGAEKKMSLTPDMAFNLEAVQAQKRKKQIVISLRPWMQHEERVVSVIAQFCDLISQQGYQLIFLPFQTFQDDDRLILGKVYEHISNKKGVHILSQPVDMYEALRIIGESELLIGMRLHSLIFSTIQSTPFIGLGYSQKIFGFVREAGQEDLYIELSQLNPEVLDEKWRLIQTKLRTIEGMLSNKRSTFHQKNLESIYIQTYFD